MDSYQMFLDYFHIDKEEFFKWGLSETIFPADSIVNEEWEKLKKRIFNNGKVFIRGYGRDAHGTYLYQEFYKMMFNNELVKKDPTNNFQPKKIIEKLTGKRRNNNIFNYQISHIWGHTKNIFLFEAPWNICYIPKIMDPFTGHEAKGEYPEKYQQLFRAAAYNKYKVFIEDYNKLIRECNVEQELDKFIQLHKGQIPENELIQFAKDAKIELSEIVIK